MKFLIKTLPIVKTFFQLKITLYLEYQQKAIQLNKKNYIDIVIFNLHVPIQKVLRKN